MSRDVFLDLNKAHYPVTVLGPGRRIGLWFQGCSIGCPGCISKDTWAQGPIHRISVTKLLAWCREMAAGGLDGFTISGGEPFDQAEGLSALLDGLIAWRRDASADFNILCYSGYTWRRLQEVHSNILPKLDAVIPEPFKQNTGVGMKWRGSSNQPLIALSHRGELAFASSANAEAVPQIQVAVNDGKIWLIGIPPRGGMDRFVKSCEDKGLKLKGASWRP